MKGIRTRMIVGASGPISSSILKGIKVAYPRDRLLVVSRSPLDSTDDTVVSFVGSCNDDTSTRALHNKFCRSPFVIQTLMFLPSEWGEDVPLSADRLVEFLNAGAVSLLRLVSTLNELGMLEPRTKVLSFGSIAEDDRFRRRNVAHKINKNMQREIANYLTTMGISQISHVKFGSFGEDGVHVEDVISLIRFMENLSDSAHLEGLELRGLCDRRT